MSKNRFKKSTKKPTFGREIQSTIRYGSEHAAKQRLELNSAAISSACTTISINKDRIVPKMYRLFIGVMAYILVGVVMSGPAYAAFVSRHGLTPSEYQSEFDKQKENGFRLTYISGYSVNEQDRYAAIWEQKEGPSYVTHHDMTSAQYQAKFNKWKKKGYRLTHVSGFSSKSSGKFAAIWEKKVGPPYVARHNMSSSKYQAEFKKWKKKGYRLVHVSGYSKNRIPRFAAIWEKKKGPPYVARHNMSSIKYQAEFNKWTKKGYRLTQVSGYASKGRARYAAIWEKSPGPAYLTRHGLNGANYQSLAWNTYYSGYYPVKVSAFSIDNKAQFAAIYHARPEKLSAKSMQNINDKVDDFMETYDVKGLSFAISQDERLVFAQGYGYASEKTKWRASPRLLFRVASVSKPITSIAMMKLLEKKYRLSLNKKVWGDDGIFGNDYLTDGKTYDSRLYDITLQHLLEHTAGIDVDKDPMFLKPNLDQGELITWVLDNRKFLTEPGKIFDYSNFGYCVLGRVIEKLSGMSYEEYVKENIFAQAGISDMHIAGDLQTDRRSNEVYYYDNDDKDPYSMKTARMDAHGGWIGSSVDLVRLLSQVDGFSNITDILKPRLIAMMTSQSKAVKALDNKKASNPDIKQSTYAKGWWLDQKNAHKGWEHGGSFPGSRARLYRRDNGINWSAQINTSSCYDPEQGKSDCTERPLGADLRKLIVEIINETDAWPSYDLF